MNIYKVKFRCTKCRNVWIEDADVYASIPFISEIRGDSYFRNVKCEECGGSILTLSLYNDSIANIDDDIKFDKEESDDW